MDKKKPSKQAFCLKFITPALQRAGWDVHEQIFMNYTLKPGRTVMQGRLKARFVDSSNGASFVFRDRTDAPDPLAKLKQRLLALAA